MKVAQFQNLPEAAPSPTTAVTGECFLQGERMIEQKTTKRVGDDITYYVVSDKTSNGYLTTARYDYLEE